MTSHIVTTPWTKPPLSLNDRHHWRARARITADIRHTTAVLAKHSGVPTGAAHATVTLHYRPRDNRRRDADNLLATAKACFDGLIDHGLVPDDTPDLMTKAMPVIHPAVRGAAGELWLEITTTEGDEA